jgi:hypothetical protein
VDAKTVIWRSIYEYNPLAATKVAVADYLMSVVSKGAIGFDYEQLSKRFYSESVRQVVAGISETRDNWIEQQLGGSVVIVVPLNTGYTIDQLLGEESFLQDDEARFYRGRFDELTSRANELVEKAAQRFTLWDAFIALGDYKYKTAIPSIVRVREKLKYIENKFLFKVSATLDDSLTAVPSFLRNKVVEEFDRFGLKKAQVNQLEDEKLGCLAELLLSKAPQKFRGTLRILLSVAPDTLKACEKMRYVMALHTLRSR